MDFRIFESVPGFSILVRPQPDSFVIVAATNDFVRAYKNTPDQITESNIQRYYAAECLGKVMNALHKVTDDQTEVTIEGVMLTNKLDGHDGLWRVRNVPVNDEEGRIQLVIQTFIPSSATEDTRDVQQAYKFFKDAPVIIGYVRGDEYIIDFANDGLLRVWNKSKAVIGQSLLSVFPELAAQGIKELLDNVRKTGNPFYAYSYPLTFMRDGREETLFFDFVYHPFYKDSESVASGIFSVGYDVTPQVKAKQIVEESERKWKQLADSMPAIVWTGEADGNISFLNQQWYEFTGLTESESLGFNWSKVVHPDDKDRCLGVWNDCRERECFYEIEVRYKNREGIYRWMIARGTPIKEDGKVVAWYGTSTDIHERKLLEISLEDIVRERTLALAEKNKLLDNIMTHSSNGISVTEMIFDNRGEVVDAITLMANDAAVRYAGIPRELYLTKRATAFDPDIISSPYGQTCLKTLKTGEPSIIQYYIDYSAKWLELTISRMDDSHLIHIFTDVTPIKNSQLQLEKSLEDLKFANANLEEFAYAASHDLKEPVRKVQFFTNRLKEELKGQLTDAQQNLFERLEQSAFKMQKLIEDLLEYSQASRGSSVWEEVDLNKVIKNVQEDLELEVQRKQAVITADTLPTIKGDPRQIQQLFQNLFSNALKYSTPDTYPNIAVTTKNLKGSELNKNISIADRERLFHFISIADNGIGFDPQHADKIFNVFTRLHGTAQYKGSGIGLSIVKRVVERHQGLVWAESEVGKGAVFNILFPVSEVTG